MDFVTLDQDMVSEVVSDAMACISEHLQSCGIRLGRDSEDELQIALWEVLEKAEVKVLDNEGTPLDPYEKYRGEVA